MLKDEFTGNPRLGQNAIDKVKSMIFVPVLAFKRRFEVCYVMFQVNNYVLGNVFNLTEPAVCANCGNKLLIQEINDSILLIENPHVLARLSYSTSSQ